MTRVEKLMELSVRAATTLDVLEQAIKSGTDTRIPLRDHTQAVQELLLQSRIWTEREARDARRTPTAL